MKVPEIIILVPSLLGLKGNLEMTLASRLSTEANLGHMDDPKEQWSMILGNLTLVQVFYDESFITDKYKFIYFQCFKTQVSVCFIIFIHVGVNSLSRHVCLYLCWPFSRIMD